MKKSRQKHLIEYLEKPQEEFLMQFQGSIQDSFRGTLYDSSRSFFSDMLKVVPYGMYPGVPGILQELFLRFVQKILKGMGFLFKIFAEVLFPGFPEKFLVKCNPRRSWSKPRTNIRRILYNTTGGMPEGVFEKKNPEGVRHRFKEEVPKKFLQDEEITQGTSGIISEKKK